MLASPSQDIRDRALLNPTMNAEQFRDAVAADQLAVLGNPKLPAEWMAHFLRSPIQWVRHAIAQNDGLSPEAQLHIASSPGRSTRKALGRNPKLTPEARTLLEKQGILMRKPR